jgi:stage V sporulation protein R
MTLLSDGLVRAKKRIEEIAKGEGLDFHPVVFEMVDYEQMNHIAAYGGFPTRYPHWRFGMEFDRLSKSHRYGLSKIYELVINTNPVYAYLLTSNSLMDQKLVMAHVYGHADFFKNNTWFSRTNRKMLDQAANHATRIRRYIQIQGQDAVESFIDACLTLEDLIDPHSVFIQRRADPAREPGERPAVRKLKSKDYMDRYINPPEYLERQEKKIQEDLDRERHFPRDQERDVLLFLMQHAPLEPWQRDVISIIRDEAYYFAPQAMTKIMNEGWASFWHTRLMTGRLLTDSEIIDYADHHSGTVSMLPGQLNPYKIGIELFRNIEDRWNRGRFGKDYEECESYAQKQAWDLKLGRGLEKVFEVRKIYNDVTFIDTFLTEDFCREHKLFTFAGNERTGKEEIKSREFQAIKKQLLFMLTNSGKPFIYVKDGNFGNRGELCLWHRYEGMELKRDYAEATLKTLNTVWGRPVHIETVFEDTSTRLGFDGKELTEEDLEAEV